MLAAHHKLPAVYPYRLFVDGGGLISYSSSMAEQDRGAASYVDRILKGEKPADLPVQTPTKFELAIKPKDCEGSTRPRRATDAARPRRRGDRVKMPFAAVAGSSCGFLPEKTNRGWVIIPSRQGEELSHE